MSGDEQQAAEIIERQRREIDRLCGLLLAEQEKSKRLGEVVKLCVADYMHAWPNEDKGTEDHRFRMLERMLKAGEPSHSTQMPQESS